DTIGSRFGAVDVLINNAGAASRGESVDYSIEEWDRIIELNLTAPFLLSRGLAPAMLERGRGKVLFTASLWSFLGGWQVPAYTVTKSAIAGLIRALSNEWAPRGIQVNGIAPGYVDTDLTRPVIEDPERAPRYLSRIPTGRWGQPTDIVGAALFLASSHADYITGTILPVDGGWLAN
ncbi:MAG: SDR family oxidoreductase, partial [Candidatus Nanopelagicales bacterium]